MTYTQMPPPMSPPPWAGYPHMPQPHVPDRTFEIATLAGIDRESRRQSEIMLGILHRLDELPERIATRISPPKPDASHPPPLGLKDWVQVAAGIGAVAAVLTGKLTWAQAIALAGKPFGL